jgi:hypothetical protein
MVFNPGRDGCPKKNAPIGQRCPKSSQFASRFWRDLGSRPRPSAKRCGMGTVDCRKMSEKLFHRRRFLPIPAGISATWYACAPPRLHRMRVEGKRRVRTRPWSVGDRTRMRGISDGRVCCHDCCDARRDLVIRIMKASHPGRSPSSAQGRKPGDGICPSFPVRIQFPHS